MIHVEFAPVMMPLLHLGGWLALSNIPHVSEDHCGRVQTRWQSERAENSLSKRRETDTFWLEIGAIRCD